MFREASQFFLSKKPVYEVSPDSYRDWLRIMPEKKHIRFIVNPFSGSNRRRNLPKLIAVNLDHSIFSYEIAFTKHAGHAAEMAREAVAAGFYMVVACGGDGSVNEIAGQLIEKQAVLGILPCGSGNGFAMHLGIGRDVAKAIRHLNSGQELLVDTCRMNEKTFVNLAGVGFDGVVAKRLHGSHLRGLWAYLKYSLEETWAYKMQPFDIEVDGNCFRRDCLLVEVANAPVYGYGFSIVPTARLNDGKLDVVVAKAAPKWRYLLECWRFFNHSFHKSKLVEYYVGKEITVTPLAPTGVHVDGEGFDLAGAAKFSISPKTLKVLCPKKYVLLAEAMR